MSLSETIILLKAQVAEAEEHVKSLEGGKKVSATKARANLMKVKNLAHEPRKQITETTKKPKPAVEPVAEAEEPKN